MNRHHLPLPTKTPLSWAVPKFRRVSLALGLAGALTVGPMAWAEVTPVPPGSTAGQAPGQPGAVPPVAVPKPASAPSNLPARPAVPNNTVKTATTAANLPAIDGFIKDSVVRLTATDNAANEQARADLIAGAASPNVQTPNTLLYLQQYVNTLSSQLQPTITKGTLRQRINAGIVIARVLENVVAAKAGTPLTPFGPQVLALMQDPCDGVALWGTKAAGVLLNANPGTPPNQPLLNAIVAAAQNHKLNGAITEEVYNALTDPSAPVIAALLQLYAARVAAYDGTNVPSDPQVDRLAISHLVDAQRMWPKMSPQQQRQALGLTSQALANAIAAYSKGTLAADVQGQTRSMMQETSKSVNVIATTTSDSALYASSNKVIKLQDSAPVTEVVSAVQLEIADLNANPTVKAGGGGNAGNAGGAAPANAGNNAVVTPVLAKP